jgi:hypothetical protein
VHHTDAEREYAYDRDSHFGRLSRGLDAAKQQGWAAYRRGPLRRKKRRRLQSMRTSMGIRW